MDPLPPTPRPKLSAEARRRAPQVPSACKKTTTRRTRKTAERDVYHHFINRIKTQGMASNTPEPPCPSDAYAPFTSSVFSTQQTITLSNEPKEKAGQENVQVGASKTGFLGAEVVAFGRDGEERVREQVMIDQPDKKSSRSPTPTPSISSPIGPVPNTIPSSIPDHIETQNPLSLVHEKSSTLALLGGMFGKGEWGGRESVRGDEMETMEVEGEVDAAYEVVPRVADEVASDAGVGDKDEIDNNEQDNPHSPIKHSSLKDMFKPQE
ncbi:hypothetical protein RSOLAG22IIIB_09130 [Rhizoctonia solani]|uniref:Uncharacterized protein n=1 Tax=Rhizoctonia solani TaxID=456999 RepID=A0A0K6FXF9_9AGAM|nr:hypothetical protein RSOLAG22IIIB_09130 [Rhizoctonia solani]